MEVIVIPYNHDDVDNIYQSYQRTKYLIHQKTIEKYVLPRTFEIFNDIEVYGLKDRAGQSEMALDIAEAIRDKEHIMIEAGVGIGKSLGYLIPSILAREHLDGPIILVTSSIALSEQLMEDINYTKYITKKSEISSILAKGASQYVCQQKLHKISDMFTVQKYPDSIQFKNMRISKRFLNLSQKCHERADFPIKLKEKEWNLINGDDCKIGQCPYDVKKYCKYVNMRNIIGDKGDIDIIVINMNMFLVSMINDYKEEKGFINRNMSLVVIDEAHNLENKTRTILTETWSEEKFLKCIRRIGSIVAKHGTEKHLKLYELIENFTGKYFNIINRHTAQKNDNVLYEHDVQRLELPAIAKIDTLKKWKIYFNELSLFLSLHDNVSRRSAEDPINEFSKLTTFVMNLYNHYIGRSNVLFWLEAESRKSNQYNICCAPKDIDSELNKFLFKQHEFPIILTSATLTQPGCNNNEMYKYQIDSIGFEGDLSDSKPSPFPYDTNSLLYVPSDIALPVNRPQYIEDISNSIMDLCKITNGRTLVLFTAKEDLKSVYDILLSRDLPWAILNQLDGLSTSQLKDKLTTTGGILLATNLWEGFNVKGSALSSVIITRLPFPVPDPIIDYKINKFKNRLNVLVPEMLIKLRQGAGRLIRDDTDFGILSILDSRAHEKHTKPYVNDIYQALPIKKRTDDLTVVNDFFLNGINNLFLKD